MNGAKIVDFGSRHNYRTENLDTIYLMQNHAVTEAGAPHSMWGKDASLTVVSTFLCLTRNEVYNLVPPQ